MNKSLLLACGALAIGSPVFAQEAPAGPFSPPFGYDLSAFDQSVKPGDDFFQYANGSYLARTQIPADRPIASRRYDMSDRTEAQLMRILREASVGTAVEPSDIKGKVGAFYAAYINQAGDRRSRCAGLGSRA